MGIDIAPASIIFLSDNISSSVLSTFVTQLFIDQTLDATTFDAYVSADAYYVQNVHLQNQRILVLRNLNDLTNRTLADLVLYARGNLVAVDYNKSGAPSKTLGIARCYISALMDNAPIDHPFHRHYYNIYHKDKKNYEPIGK